MKPEPWKTNHGHRDNVRCKAVVIRGLERSRGLHLNCLSFVSYFDSWVQRHLSHITNAFLHVWTISYYILKTEVFSLAKLLKSERKEYRLGDIFHLHLWTIFRCLRKQRCTQAKYFVFRGCGRSQGCLSLCFHVRMEHLTLVLWRIEITDMKMMEFCFLNSRNRSLFLGWINYMKKY